MKVVTTSNLGTADYFRRRTHYKLAPSDSMQAAAGCRPLLVVPPNGVGGRVPQVEAKTEGRVMTVLPDAADSAGPTPRVQWEHCTLLTAHGAQASLPHMMHLR